MATTCSESPNIRCVVCEIPFWRDFEDLDFSSSNWNDSENVFFFEFTEWTERLFVIYKEKTPVGKL